MVTCDPNELVASIHPKAMITILHPRDWDRWLTAGYDDIVPLQKPYPADRMTVRGPVFPTREKKDWLRRAEYGLVALLLAASAVIMVWQRI